MFLSSPMDAGQAFSAFITPRMGSSLAPVLAGRICVAMAQETGIEPKPVLPALTYLRLAFQADMPHLFSATVEVDEAYLGRQWKNKRHRLQTGATKPGRGTSQRPVFGILCPGRKVWDQVVPDVEAKTLLPWICRRLEAGGSVCSDPRTSDTGIAAKG